jgi:hypothetical protein
MNWRFLLHLGLSIGLALNALYAQIPTNSDKVAFEVLDSTIIKAPRYAKANRWGYSVSMVRDSIYMHSGITGEVFVFNISGQLIDRYKIPYSKVKIGKNENLPAYTGLLPKVNKKCKYFTQSRLWNKEFLENCILVEGGNFWGIFSKKNKKLISSGFFVAPSLSDSECYIVQKIQRRLIIINKDGKKYLLAPLYRHWPKFWEISSINDCYYDYEINSSFYAPENYLIAEYPIPSARNEAQAQEKKSETYAIKPHRLLVKLEKTFAPGNRGSFLLRTDICVDTLAKRLYVGLDSEHQVRVYDYEGNHLAKVGQRGKYLAADDTLEALSLSTVLKIDSLAAQNKREEALAEYELYKSDLQFYSYRYYHTWLDPLGGYLFRYYQIPEKKYRQLGESSLLLPQGHQSRICGLEKKVEYALQIFDLKSNGKLLYEGKIKHHKNLSLMQINAPGDYWIFGYYMGDMTKAKIYRVKMKVKEEEY